MALLGPGPDRAGDHQRLFGATPGVAPPRGQHQRLGVIGQDAGPLGRRLDRQDPHRLLQGGQARRLVAGRPVLVPQPHEQQRCPHRVDRRVQLVERLGEQHRATLGSTGG